MLRIGVVGPTFPPIEVIAEVAKSIEEKGYDSIWFPDHLMGWFPHTMWTPEIVGALAPYSPHTFFETTLSIAMAALSTKRIRIGVRAQSWGSNSCFLEFHLSRRREQDRELL